jgi:nucleoside-diphosphate-sugar epimerase
MIRGKRN